MKHSLIILSVVGITQIGLISCSNNNESANMKTPVETKEGSTTVGTTPLNKDTAKQRTIVNMQDAFKGETNATARYAAFSKKAAEEGYNEIALLFKAASQAESIHAANHKVVLEEMGVQVANVIPEVNVKSTKENLEFAIKGETYEATEMYPNFLKEANDADNQLALISLNYAYKTEKKHKQFYEKALAALNSNTVAQLPTVYFVCPTCGNTYETEAPKRCGISMTNGDKFIKIASL